MSAPITSWPRQLRSLKPNLLFTSSLYLASEYRLTAVAVLLSQLFCRFIPLMMLSHIRSRLCSGFHVDPTFDGSLFGSNNPPSPSEECKLRDGISVGEARVAVIDNRVAALKEHQQVLSTQLALIDAELEDLGSQRGEVSARIAEYKRLLSPVRRLPPEILLKIFLGTAIFPMPRTQSQRDRYWWDFHPTESALWSIELVCKKWRRAALGFPELWSSINIFLSDENFLSSDFRYVRQLALQITRTRHYPLSILICAGSPQTSASSKSLPPQISTLLFSTQDRIQSLYLYLPPAMFTFVSTLQLYLPVLRNLALLSTDSEEFQKLPRMKLFRDTPLLIVLDIVDIKSVDPVLDLPYHQITHYSTYHVFHRRRNPGPATSHILGMLSKAKNLEECDLRCELCDLGYSSLVRGALRSCQRLRTLTLSSWGYPNSVLARLLDTLVIPRLSTLAVHCCVDDGCVPRSIRDNPDTFTAIRRAIRRSQSPLTTFHFTHGYIAEQDLLALFLIASSTLQEVKLFDVGPRALTNGILAPLVISDADNVLLPRLHTLHISGEMQFDANLLAEMVKSRWTCKGPSFRHLRTIILHRSLNIEDDKEEEELARALALSNLEEHCTEGLRLSYSIL
ncbi:hypothetical protein IW261DRAFT_991137 [Armillaria novae-zelandiae]|uniref:F-box domain-containing protein n=1 Tax=Armillaria novae-zelandiae TaxID=153914 RepID=A0AA39PHQ5_9AGAR|nr:hypothetical protein IW261DRAFT_991137 [Armillaria novae-zelandiae]